MDGRSALVAAAVALLTCLAIEAGPPNIVIGSTTFTLTDQVQRCMDRLGLGTSNSTNPGGDMRKCLRKMRTTTRAPNETYFANQERELLVSEEGSTALLRCDIINLGKKRVFWWRGRDSLLSSMSILHADDRRFKLDTYNSTFNLRIERVRKSDAGRYKCQILARRFQAERIVDLEVPSLPNIISLEPTSSPFYDQSDPDRRYFNSTTDVALYCNASGSPEPTVAWERVGLNYPTRVDPPTGVSSWGNTVLLNNISKRDAGVYNCTASNGVGSIERSIEVVVQYKPIVSSPAPSIRAGRTRYVTVECEVSAVPRAEIVWKRDQVTIQTAGQGSYKNGIQYTTFIIVSVDPGEDYGRYTCVAGNMIGSSLTSIEVHGRPLPPTVTSVPRSTRRHAYTLAWEPGTPLDERRPQEIPVSSYIIQFRGWWIQKIGALRRVVYTHDNPLREVIPAVEGQQTYGYVIRDLRPNTTYEMTMYGRNQYGNGDQTTFTFYTAWENAPSTPILATTTDAKATAAKVTPKALQSGATAVRTSSVSSFVVLAFLAAQSFT